MEENKQSTMEKLIGKWKEKKKVLIFALILLAMISTVLVSFVIQNNTKQPIIDTVVVEPIEERNIILSGQVRYSDRSAFANGNVELHSEAKKTTTDDKGWFLFEEVTPEEHKLTVFDKSGNELASASIDLKQLDSKTELNIEKDKDGKYRIELSVDTRYLELAIELRDHQLIISADNTYAVNDTGKVYNDKGVLDSKDGYILLPSGTVITDGNDIIRFPYILDSDDAVSEVPKDGTILDDGTKVDGDGTITLPDGTVIDKDGTITDNDGNEYQPDDNGPIHIKPDGDIEPIKPTPPKDEDNKSDENNPTTPPDHNNSDNPDISDPETPVDPDNPDITDPDIPVDPDTPINPDNPDKPDIPDDQEPNHDDSSFNVTGQIKNTIGDWTNPWRVNTSIDLFHNQSGGVSKYKNGMPVIQPGSSGYYIFQIENKRDTLLDLEIYIKEATYHLPMRYRLAPIHNYDESLPANLKWTDSVSLDKKTIIQSSQVGIGKNVLYRLEWEWPYESNHDDIDTKQGIQAEVYKVNIGIGIK